MHSKVFKIAHQIKATFQTWSEALKAAWKIVKLRMNRQVVLTFAKSSGEVRTAVAIGCGRLDTLAKGYLKFVEQVEDGTQWRSFRLERLIFA